jgi:hypothetical protein
VIILEDQQNSEIEALVSKKAKEQEARIRESYQSYVDQMREELVADYSRQFEQMKVEQKKSLMHMLGKETLEKKEKEYRDTQNEAWKQCIQQDSSSI